MAVGCRKTPDGRTYPVDLPWGNMGVSMGAICAAGIYNKMGADTKIKTEASCFIEEQIGYATNHKCSRKGEACNTGKSSGYSYIIGCAARHVLCAGCRHFWPEASFVYAARDLCMSHARAVRAARSILYVRAG